MPRGFTSCDCFPRLESLWFKFAEANSDKLTMHAAYRQHKPDKLFGAPLYVSMGRTVNFKYVLNNAYKVPGAQDHRMMFLPSNPTMDPIVARAYPPSKLYNIEVRHDKEYNAIQIEVRKAVDGDSMMQILHDPSEALHAMDVINIIRAEANQQNLFSHNTKIEIIHDMKKKVGKTVIYQVTKRSLKKKYVPTVRLMHKHDPGQPFWSHKFRKSR